MRRGWSRSLQAYYTGVKRASREDRRAACRDADWVNGQELLLLLLQPLAKWPGSWHERRSALRHSRVFFDEAVHLLFYQVILRPY